MRRLFDLRIWLKTFQMRMSRLFFERWLPRLHQSTLSGRSRSLSTSFA